MIVQAAYLAGFIDGEAHFSVLFRTNKPGRRPFYEVVLEIGQKRPEVLYAIRAEYGGNLKVKGAGTKKELWVLYWASKGDLRRIIETVEPYLITKKADAQRALSALGTNALAIRNRAS